MKKKVFILDDNPHILEAIQLILESEGYGVKATAKADEIMRQVKGYMPDIILLDLLLSGKNGQEVAQQLREDKLTTKIPIVFISAHPSAEKAAKQSGADAFIAKPFDIDELLSVIHRFTPVQ